nr:hypothetical protein [Tanacetum cinerariifolium]
MVSSSGVEEHVDATLNKEDVNVGQTPASPNVNPKPESIRAINARFANYVWDTWVRYGLGKSSYARAMIEVRVDVKLKDTIMVAMPKLSGEGFYTCNEECPKNPSFGVAKNLKKPSRGPRGVTVGPKLGFKTTKEYRPVPKNPTATTSGNKKKGVESTKELVTGPILMALRFWNVKTSSTSTTLIVDKIGKLEKVIIDGKVTFVDDEGKPLKKDSYEKGDNDEDPYNDDMCEGQDIPDKIQDICDKLDIRVRGRKKK